MHDCLPNVAPIMKGNNFSLDPCLMNDLEKEFMKNFPYVMAIRYLGNVQVCTRPNIAFIIGMIRRYIHNLSLGH